MVEGAHTSFLHQITGKPVRCSTYSKWVITATGEVQEAAGMYLAAAYIGRRQGGVDQWVALRPIFESCVR